MSPIMCRSVARRLPPPGIAVSDGIAGRDIMTTIRVLWDPHLACAEQSDSAGPLLDPLKHPADPDSYDSQVTGGLCLR